MERTNETREYYALTRKAFDFLAPVYDLITAPLIHVRRQVVDIANARKGLLVLDVATGTGQQAFAFARRGCDVTGIDLTASMLDVARKNNKAGLVRFERADASQMRFGTDSFDITCISFALHDMPLPIRAQVLKEMRRITKPNCAIVAVDYALPVNRIWRALIYRLISIYEEAYYKEFIVSDLEALLDHAGIQVTKRSSTLLGAGTILVGTKR
jgi:demethylmenaquinone methyltransferase/2-methoxy-6-polyprenyl-1,4-benzoquinol methylase